MCVFGNGISLDLNMFLSLNKVFLLQDFQNIGAKNVCIMTDANVSKISAFQIVLDSMHRHDVNYKVYDNVRVEPTDTR